MDLAAIVLIVTSFLFIFFFAGIEVAYATANRLNIELQKKQGLRGGVLLSRLVDEPSQFIGTLLVGFNLFLVLFVLVVSSYSDLLLHKVGVTDSLILPVRLTVEILFSVLIVIVLGEFLPKALFRAHSDRLLSLAASSGLLGALHDALRPIARALVRLSQWMLTVIFDMRIDKRREPLSRAKLEQYFQQTKDFNSEGPVVNTELFEAALALPNVKVRECLVPRKEIEALPLTATVEEARLRFISTKLSKLIVYDGSIDDIVGYIHQLDLFREPASLKEILLPIPAVPESMSAVDLIGKLSAERKSVAWVVDEFGGTSGIVTMEDILEEIFGEIRDEYDVEELEEKRISESEFMLSGRLELDYLRDKYELSFPEDAPETLSGYIIQEYGSIPRLKERIIIQHYEFEILHVSDTRIEMVRLRKLQ